MSRLAALGMYDFAEVAPFNDRMWTYIANALAGEGVDAVPATLERSIPLAESWLRSDLLLGQTCGMPLVKTLHSQVTVVGTFVSEFADSNGRYASVIIVPRNSTANNLADLQEVPVRAAINGWESLSGYASLGYAFFKDSDPDSHHYPNLARNSPFSHVLVTGGHVASIEAVASGSADVASIDAHTFGLLSHHRPSAIAGVRVVGRGPRVPCLPLISSTVTDATTLSSIRRTLNHMCTHDALHETLRQLGITGFTPLTMRDYEPVADILSVGCFPHTDYR